MLPFMAGFIRQGAQPPESWLPGGTTTNAADWASYFRPLATNPVWSVYLIAAAAALIVLPFMAGFIRQGAQPPESWLPGGTTANAADWASCFRPLAEHNPVWLGDLIVDGE